MISAISHHHNIENDHLRIMKCMIWNELYIIVNDLKSKKTQLRSVLATRDKVHGCGDDGALPTGLLLGLRRKLSIETSSPTCFGPSFFCNRSEPKIQPESNLELVATGLIVIWQYLLRGPPTCDREWFDSPIVPMPMGPMCLSPNKRQPSHDPIALIQSLIWNAAMALVNVVELHRPLHVAKNAAKCATSTESTWWQSWCFQTKGQVSQVFSRKRGSNHGEVRGTANQLDDMLEPRLIAAQALHIQGNNICSQMTSLESSYIQTNLIT